MEGSQKEATQTPPIHVHMPFQPRHSLHKDLSITVNHQCQKHGFEVYKQAGCVVWQQMCLAPKRLLNIS